MRVQLSGYVTDNDTAKVYRYYGYSEVCCPNDIREALAKTPEGEELIFEINSGGGGVYDGFQMYTVLRDSKREAICEIQSIAGSAASVFAMGCGVRRISPVASMFIHRSSSGARGNSEIMRRAKQMLDTVDEGILSAYEERVKENLSREKLRSMLEMETFMTAQEAVQHGFATEIMFQEDKDTALTKSAVAMAGGLKLAMASLPPIDELKRLSGEEDHKNTGKPERKEKNTMELKDLERDHPNLVQKIREQAATAERQRINGIEALGLPGFEDLIDKAKKDPKATAESVAIDIVNRQKQQGKDFLKGREEDVKDSGVDNVEPSAKSGNADDEKWNRAMAEAFPKN